MAASTNIHGFNIGGNNNSFDQRGHFYRSFLNGNVSGMLVKQNSTPNMTVLVEHGSALLNKNTISASIAEVKSNTSVAIDTANTANPRIDTVVIYEDTSVAIPTIEANYWQDGAGGRFKIVSLPGTAAASPVALSDAAIQSAIGAGKPWTRLADITVPANSTTIINSNINSTARNKLGVSLSSINSGANSGTLASDPSGNVTVKSPKIGVIPGTTLNSTGNKSITGVGFKPSIVRFTMLPPYSGSLDMGVGAMTPTSQYGVAIATGYRTHSKDGVVLKISGSGADQMKINYVSMDADGFTINVSLALNFDVAYEAYP